MKAHPNLPKMFTGVNAAINRYGDDIWEIVCAKAHPHRSFRLEDVAPAVAADLGLKIGTARQYTKAVLRNVSLELSGEGSVQKDGHFWRWNHRIENGGNQDG